MTELINMFNNYANFKDRTTKRGYWMAMLFVFIALLVANFVLAIFGGFGRVIGYLIDLALCVPSLAIAVRRLRDAGKPWYYVLLTVIPGLFSWIPLVGPLLSLAGSILLIIFLVQDSVPPDGTPVV